MEKKEEKGERKLVWEVKEMDSQKIAWKLS